MTENNKQENLITPSPSQGEGRGEGLHGLPKVGSYEMMAEPFHCDFTRHLFLGHLGNALLNAADFHSNDRGYGLDYLNPRHKTWVLSRLAIEIVDEMPRDYDHFTVETWVESVMRYFTSRNFVVTAKDGRQLVWARSIWAMIDTQTRQPIDILNVNNGIIQNYVEKDKPNPIQKCSRVAVDAAKSERVGEVVVRYNDVDMNGHLNSIRYIDHVLDIFPLDFICHHRLRRLEIAYVMEAYPGEKLTLWRETTDNLNYGIRITKPKDDGEVEIARCKVTFC